MKWMKERDLLIAQTLAFVQSVTGDKPEAAPGSERDSATLPVAAASIETARVALEIVDRPKAIQIPKAPIPPAAIPPAVASAQVPRSIPGDYRSEIQSRVANFRAHQERFNREREAYFNATFAKARAVIGNDPASTPPRK